MQSSFRPVTEPKIQLLHIKASGSDKPNRGLSASDYEIVANQAVKNLRSLDTGLLGQGLVAGLAKKISGTVRKPDGSIGTRNAMLAELKKISGSYQRSVIVLQPRVRKSMLDAERAQKGNAKHTSTINRLLQLETILVSAGQACGDLSAELTVLGSS